MFLGAPQLARGFGRGLSIDDAIRTSESALYGDIASFLPAVRQRSRFGRVSTTFRRRLAACLPTAHLGLSMRSTFAPQSRPELKTAVDICLRLSPKGDCSQNMHGSIGKWDVSRVTDMSSIFSEAKSFQADISTWDVSSVISMNSMFMGAQSLSLIHI